MSSVLDAEYLTVAEAAKALRVSESTIWRWIDQGRLPAYRVGERKIRLKNSDVACLITPARRGMNSGGLTAEVQRENERLSRPLTQEEQDRALAALEAAELLQREILTRHGLKRFTPSSSKLLKEARDDRTRQLS